MTTQNPTFAEVIDAAMVARMREMFGGWLPGRIETYDEDSNKASVQILVEDEYLDEDGERVTEPFPVIDDIPVAWPSLAGKFVFRIALSPGDECMVMFGARATSKFFKTGGMVDPEDDRHHDINDACVLPCRLSNGGANADPCIDITTTSVNIGGTSNLVTRSEFLDHAHPTAAVGPPSVPQRVTGDPSATPPIASLAVGTVGFPGTQKLKGG